MLKSSMKPEHKYVDSAVGGGVMTTSAGALLLNGIAQGDTASQRSGFQVKSIALDIKLMSYANVTAVSNVSRIMVVLDRQPNGAAVTAAGILTNPTDVNSMYNLGNSFRYKILKDIRLTQTTLTETDSIVRKIHIPLKFITHWSALGTGATITDITSNSLYLVYMGDEATNGATLNAFCRYRFSDL